MVNSGVERVRHDLAMEIGAELEWEVSPLKSGVW
jgi:hypothetical protein